jgi:hypothetical protein
MHSWFVPLFPVLTDPKREPKVISLVLPPTYWARCETNFPLFARLLPYQLGHNRREGAHILGPDYKI